MMLRINFAATLLPTFHEVLSVSSKEPSKTAWNWESYGTRPQRDRLHFIARASLFGRGFVEFCEYPITL